MRIIYVYNVHIVISIEIEYEKRIAIEYLAPHKATN